MSGTSECRHLTLSYCVGNGIDIGSGGDPVVSSAIQVDLVESAFENYGHVFSATVPIQWRGDGRNLPFKDEVLDYVYSSHLLEDFLDWTPLLTEWIRVLKPGGNLVIIVPDKFMFNECIRLHGGGNASHKHESYEGELTSVIQNYGKFQVVYDKRQTTHPLDYNIVFIAQKL